MIDNFPTEQQTDNGEEKESENKPMPGRVENTNLGGFEERRTYIYYFVMKYIVGVLLKIDQDKSPLLPKPHKGKSYQ